MQYGSPNDLDAARNDPFIETMDLGIVTLQPRGPAPESVLMDITMDPGTIGADASTLSQGQPHRVGPQNGARPNPFGLNLPTPVPGKPPLQPRSHPRADLSNLQPADLTTSLMDTVARLQNEVYALKFAPPVSPTPTLWTQEDQYPLFNASPVSDGHLSPVSPTTSQGSSPVGSE